jgi:hypothetical protein
VLSPAIGCGPLADDVHCSGAVVGLPARMVVDGL